MRTGVVLSTFACLLLGACADPAWWQTMSLYQIYPRSFKDSNGDGIGDLKGITSKLQHLVDTKVNAFWLSPMYPSPMVDFGYDISDFRDVDPVYGNLDDFKNLLGAAHNMSLKVILDFVPNHCSDKHEWFQKSIKKIDPYTDYFLWHEGRLLQNGTRLPPNNWVSLFYGSAWTWNEERKSYYFHQFAKEQPDLNFRNEAVLNETKDILRYWMNMGVDGFRVDAVPFLLEVEDLRDEPLTGATHDTQSYSYTNHIYTFDLDETYDVVRAWRNVIDEYEDRVLIIEAYGTMEQTMKYFTYGAHFPFNFGFVTDADSRTNAQNVKRIVDSWTNNLPPNSTSNWVAGNHDRSRLVNRYGADLAPVIATIIQLLPGVAVTYYGEEIGMKDTWLSWEETMDPQGCNAGKDRYQWSTRDPFRTPFQWDDSLSAGFSTSNKTWLRINDNYKELNLEAQKTANTSYYKAFVKVTELRSLLAIQEGSLTTKLLNNNKVFAFSRELEGAQSVYVVANFAKETVTVSLQDFKNVPSELEYYHSTSSADAPVGTTVSVSNEIPGHSASIFVTPEKTQEFKPTKPVL